MMHGINIQNIEWIICYLHIYLVQQDHGLAACLRQGIAVCDGRIRLEQPVLHIVADEDREPPPAPTELTYAILSRI